MICCVYVPQCWESLGMFRVGEPKQNPPNNEAKDGRLDTVEDQSPQNDRINKCRLQELSECNLAAIWPDKIIHIRSHTYTYIYTLLLSIVYICIILGVFIQYIRQPNTFTGSLFDLGSCIIWTVSVNFASSLHIYGFKIRPEWAT